MKRASFLVILALTYGFLITGCGKSEKWPCQVGDGPVKTEIRTISSFDAIELSGPMNVFVSVGNTNEITIEAENNLMDDVLTYVTGRTLVIDADGCIRPEKPINVYVPAPLLEEIKLHGSGDISGPVVTPDNFLVTVNGSGNVDLQGVDTDLLDAKISGSGDINLVGQAESTQLKVTGSGNMECFQLQALDVNVTLNGSGYARVLVDRSLYVKITGSGDAYFKGDPEDLRTDITGSGSLVKI